MKQTIWKTICLVLILGMALAGCGTPSKTAETAVYHNGYLGLTLEVPAGWYVEGVDEANFTATMEASRSLDSMEGFSWGDGGYNYDMATVQNKASSKNNDHAEMNLSADLYEDFDDFYDYLEYQKEYYFESRSDEDYFYKIKDTRSVTLNGQSYTVVEINVSLTGTKDSYTEEFYMAEIGELYFLAYINYWDDSAQSKQNAYEMLDMFRIDSSVAGAGTQAL